jgi:uncharacterized protein
MSQDPYDRTPARPDNGRTWAVLAHLGGILAYALIGWGAALVVWLTHRDRDPYVAREARAALNFQLTILIGLVICHIVQVMPVIGVVGWIGGIALSIVSLVLSVMAALATSRGAQFRYPYALELVRA